LSKIQEIFI